MQLEAKRRKDLESAFLNTNYFVGEDRGEMVLIRIGERNNRLDELLQASGESSWAFVTAHNPLANQLSDIENARLHTNLCSELNERRIRHLNGYGESSEKNWPPEKSLLLLGIDRTAARELGRRFGQLAVVVGELGGAPELVWCDED